MVKLSTIHALYFRYNSQMKKELPLIEKILVSKGLIISTEESEACITPEGEYYVESITTDEYIIDRVFDFLTENSNLISIDEILNSLKIKGVTDKRKRVIEANIIQSNLVEYQKFGYSYVFRLSTEGILKMSKTDTFSNIEKEKLLQPSVLHYNPIINTQNIDNNFGMAIQDSEIFEASPTFMPTQNITQEDKKTNQTSGLLMKFWKLISENKLISTVIAGLLLTVIYYFLFGVKPK